MQYAFVRRLILGFLLAVPAVARAQGAALEQPRILDDIKFLSADVLAGRTGAVDALDTFDLLGIVTGGFNGWKYQRGLYVRALLPDSPLAQTVPRIQPMDVIIRVGDRHFYTWQSVASLRATPIPQDQTVVLVRRDDETFEVVIDLAATREAVSQQYANQEEPAS